MAADHEKRPDERGMPMPASDDEDADDEAPIEGIVISPDAYSQGEVLRHREFDRMTPAELREAERLVDLLVPRLERRRTRRYELHSHGRRLAPRAMFRRNLGTGGQLARLGLAAPDPRAALARRPVRHLGLDGAPFATAAAVRPGAVGRVRGPHRVVRLRDAADPRHPAAARTATATARSPASPTRSTTGPAAPGSASRSGRSTSTGRGGRCGRRGSSSSCPTAGTAATRRSSRPRPPACGATATASSGSTRSPGTPGYQPLAGRHARRLPVHRRLPGGRDRREPRAPRRDPRRRPGRRHATGQRGRRARGAARRRRSRPSPRHQTSSAERPTDPSATEADRDEGTARHPGRPGRHDGTSPTSVARSSSGRSGPRRAPRAPSSCTRPTAGSPARSAAAASRAPRPRRSTRPAPPATPGSSATGSATSRRGTSAWPAAARSTCWSSRSRRPS